MKNMLENVRWTNGNKPFSQVFVGIFDVVLRNRNALQQPHSVFQVRINRRKDEHHGKKTLQCDMVKLV